MANVWCEWIVQIEMDAEFREKWWPNCFVPKSWENCISESMQSLSSFYFILYCMQFICVRFENLKSLSLIWAMILYGCDRDWLALSTDFLVNTQHYWWNSFSFEFVHEKSERKCKLTDYESDDIAAFRILYMYTCTRPFICIIIIRHKA